jgi:CheY-like chemotaxis protein
MPMAMSGKSPDVVVVDDEPAIVSAVCDALELIEVVAIGCRHGAGALQCIRERQPKLTILDVQMPEIDGIELFRRLRTDPATTHIPVIFLTANVHVVNKRLPEYQELGARLLPKPYKMGDLFEMVTNMISG